MCLSIRLIRPTFSRRERRLNDSKELQRLVRSARTMDHLADLLLLLLLPKGLFFYATRLDPFRGLHRVFE